MKDENIHAFYTSPLSRARDTAIVIARHHDLPVLATRALAAVERGSSTARTERLPPVRS